MANPYVTTVIRCAGPDCKQVKGETNHWWMILKEWAAPYGQGNAYSVAPLDTEIILKEWKWMPVCGEQCLERVCSQIRGRK